MHGVERTAIISPDGVYRYRLTRRWSRGASLCWVMLNPSTADAQRDDPTIRRCIGFSRAWGYGALVVVNLFAFRATDQADLWRAADPIGPDADDLLRRARRGRDVVVAWGAARGACGRATQVMGLLGHQALCLGVTRAGGPRHPLYAPRTVRPVQYK